MKPMCFWCSQDKVESIKKWNGLRHLGSQLQLVTNSVILWFLEFPFHFSILTSPDLHCQNRARVTWVHCSYLNQQLLLYLQIIAIHLHFRFCRVLWPSLKFRPGKQNLQVRENIWSNQLMAHYDTFNDFPLPELTEFWVSLSGQLVFPENLNRKSFSSIIEQPKGPDLG